MTEVVFEPGPRGDLGPANHGEPRSAFLDRSARPKFSAARDRINLWFNGLCPAMKSGVRARLTSKDDHEFAAGYWELYLHEMLVRLGFEVECEPQLPNGRRIDFLARRGARALYIEATVAHSSGEERAADARRERLYRELQLARTENFMFGIEIRTAGSGDMPNVRELRRSLEIWMADLDPDAPVPMGPDGLDEYPTFPWESGGWSLLFEAYAVKPEHGGQPLDRPLGVFMDETGGFIDDETPLRRALTRKAPRRYGELDHPYVIAVCENSWEHGGETWHRRNVLFGQSGVAYGDGLPPREVRQPDGYWRGPGQRPRNTRVSAVVLAAHLEPWHFDDDSLTWWDNPFAAMPVDDGLVLPAATRHQLAMEDGRGDFVILPPSMTPGEVFGVDPSAE